ncbi:MAG: hypothetical protein IKN42_04485 [Elusimicrobia bacterium]|nr:hypothetical protein [Elusimicrobiota bacterium]
MKLIKRFFLVILGILIAFLFAEIILRIFQPKILETEQLDDNNKNFFKWAYLDIHEPFFKKDRDTFYIKREDFYFPQNTKKYNYNKKNKNIFILGESTAKAYPEEILKQKLLKNFNCEVINCGMGAYDSYRIEKISKEISSLNPDWIICFIGNNDKVIENSNFKEQPLSFNPIDINYLPYKYNIVRKIFTLNLLSNIVNREIKYKTQRELEIFFKNNIIKIIKNLKNAKIIFVDLPNNKDYYYCSNIYDIIEIENDGLQLWKDTNHYKILLERLNFLKSLQEKYNNVFYTNLTELLLNYCDNNLSYNIFYDDCHWTNTTYELLSEIISKIIMKQDFDRDINITISKNDFNKKLIKDICYLSKNYAAINYFIKNNFDNLYNNYISQISQLEENLTNKIIYNNIYIYAYCLYVNGYKDLSLNILNNLIQLQPNYIEAYLTLGYIYFKQNNIKKAEEYFNNEIVKKLAPDNKINVEYLKSLKEENK